MKLFNKWRYGPLLNHMVWDMHELCSKSKIKVGRKQMAIEKGFTALSDRLNDELLAEKEIYTAIHDSISEFCKKHNIKNPLYK